ncbi:ATP-binding protein [Chryseobacterium indoltheticum]|uniref:Uncharacterized protein n=1 Tax=Chryseobacterium indoltheticum TaxID=254 RepID=A0A3G6N539_9FLAO|nr:ATP-binding protein [Chryseobacterium indoltheticum]AZA60093.1 hypothetical protein EG340_03130 [Chryseobacterium indoltheticum]
MGSLIVKKVKYSGENYSYESPELMNGINIILGDNGSGKSTFSYFIEYALGGKVKPFDNDDDDSRYSLILNDTNNYVHIDILIDSISYSLKRFIGMQDVFVDNGITTETYPINRRGDIPIFSDWLLGKLKIPVFEMYLGAAHWYFNFNDLFRLLNYDQNTEPKKIYKSPVAENFIADSIIIRKSIFEILLGISSAEYFKKLDKLKIATKKRDVAKAIFQNYGLTHEKPEDSDSLIQSQKDIQSAIAKLEQERESYQIKETTVDDKIGELAEIQSVLVDLELKTSRERIFLKSLENEQIKVDHVHRTLLEEIQQIQKIIFTHERLDLFSMEVCPFCMNKKEIAKGVCICGSKFNDDDYEKFVYNASEYKDILSHRQKSIKAITQAKQDYAEDVQEVTKKIEKNSKLIDEYTAKLKKIIKTAEFAGNTTVIDDYNNRILKLKEQLLQLDYALKTSKEWKRLSDDHDAKIAELKTAQISYNKAKTDYDLNNAETIESFNTIYSKLLAKSSYKSTEAHIDEDYMPFIDNREYRANSSDVPKRLMYYFTILSLALKLPSVKHPRFLLIDTPEDSGIDTEHLNQNLELLIDAIKLGKQDNGTFKEFQVILTTGYGKFPSSFEKYVIERFSEKDGNFILKPKTLD